MTALLVFSAIGLAIFGAGVLVGAALFGPPVDEEPIVHVQRASAHRRALGHAARSVRR